MAITVGGTSITFNDATTQSTAATGTVSSVATGNGLSGGTITTAGTLSLACPTAQSVGASGTILISGNPGYTVGSTWSNPSSIGAGTWRCMSSYSMTIGCAGIYCFLFTRVS